MTRALAAFFLCAIAFPANALTCKEVKWYVAQYGIGAVEQWAKWKNYSDKQIAYVERKCLAR